MLPYAAHTCTLKSILSPRFGLEIHALAHIGFPLASALQHSTCAAAGPVTDIDPLKPYIPAWCMLPKVSPNSCLVRSSEFVSGAYALAHIPPERWPEIAVVGRSNVGKSSLINYLIGSKLANVSKHPGKTQSINHYLINRSWCLVDCPGYGYAKVSQGARADWHAMTQEYFKTRSKLVDILLLVDASLPPKEMDLAGVAWLAKRRLPVTLIFTKTDKSKPRLPAPADNILAFRDALAAAAGGQHAIPPHFATSSAAKQGGKQLLQYLTQRVAQHAAQRVQQTQLPAAAG